MSDVPMFKLLIVGDASVGKTSVLMVFDKGEMPAVPMSTFAAEQVVKEMIFENDQKVKAKIMDTAGTEKHNSVPTTLYNGASGMMLMYDVTKGESLPGCQTWLDRVRDKAGDEIVVMLVGNKIDYVDADASARQVSEGDVKAFMEANNIAMHMETSAKTPKNVPESFKELVRKVCEVNGVRTSVAPTGPETQPDPPTPAPSGGAPNIRIGQPPSGGAKSGGCCS